MNSTNSEPVIFHSVFIATTVFCFINTAIITVGNSIVLFAIYKDPSRNLRNPSSILFTNLFVSDFLTGVLLGPITSADAFIDVFGKNSIILDLCIFLFGSLLLFVNNLTITAISFDRLIAVVKPLDHKRIVNKKTVKMVIAVIWFLSFLICLLPVFGVPQWALYLIYSHSHASVPMVFLTAMYCVIFKSLRKQRRRIFNEQSNRNKTHTLNQENRLKKRMQRDQYLTITIALVMVIFCLSQFPFVIGVHVLTYLQNCDNCLSDFWMRTAHSAIYFSARCVLLNSALDPFLLTVRMPKISQALKATYSSRPRLFKIKRTVAPRPSIVSE